MIQRVPCISSQFKRIDYIFTFVSAIMQSIDAIGKKFDQSYESVTETEKNAAFHIAMFSIY